MDTSTKAPPRRERKRLLTRRAILDAGQQLFAVRALEGITVDEIVEAADVSKGSFYNHFEDKRDLAAAILDHIQGDLESRITAANDGIGDAAERIARALGVLLAYAFDHPERVLALLSLSQRRTAADSPLNAGLAADLRAGIASGRFRGVDVETGILLVVGTFVVTLRHVTMPDTSIDVALLASRMSAGLLRGLGLSYDDSLTMAAHVADTLPPQR